MAWVGIREISEVVDDLPVGMPQSKSCITTDTESDLESEYKLLET